MYVYIYGEPSEHNAYASNIASRLMKQLYKEIKLADIITMKWQCKSRTSIDQERVPKVNRCSEIEHVG